MDERRPRPIDRVTAELDQLAAELASVSRQVAILIFAALVLSITVGLLLWRH